jgi:hypothetical protein
MYVYVKKNVLYDNICSEYHRAREKKGSDNKRKTSSKDLNLPISSQITARYQQMNNNNNNNNNNRKQTNKKNHRSSSTRQELFFNISSFYIYEQNEKYTHED